MLILAHRGAKGHVSENTLAAFQKAIALSADGIELDVHLSSDGKIFVFHDETTTRLCGVDGNFSEMTSGEIAKLRIDGVHAIPELSDVLRLVDKKCLVNVELKTASTALPTAQLIAEFVELHRWNYRQFLVSSFDWVALQQVRSEFPQIPLGVLTETDLDLANAFARAIKAETIHPHFHLLSAENVKAMQADGFKVFAWTVNPREDIENVRALGVDGLITDYPDRA